MTRTAASPFAGVASVDQDAAVADRFDLNAEAARVECPTLILGGDLDPITTATDLEDLAAAIPGSRLEIVHDTGHGLRNKPDVALAIIRDFILSPAF